MRVPVNAVAEAPEDSSGLDRGRAESCCQQGGGEELAVYIPEGVAHGFYAHDDVIMTYLVTGEYDGSDELGIAWNDPDLGISWPDEEPILSERDQKNARLADVAPDRRVPYSG